jgi:tetratricopeptide (TPR) repeat protein
VDISLFDDDLQFAITRIRLREKLATVSGEARQELIKKNLADPKLAEWVWYRFVKEDANAPPPAEVKVPAAAQVKVLPLGENLFPENVTYYAAIPQPAALLDKLGSALDGLQLDSSRSQANFVLILNSFREQLARQLDSPPGASPTVYSGINTKEPIALASWYAQGAPYGIESAQRKAIILRVTDRARFERTLTLYQQSIGNFKGLSDYFSVGIRFMTVLPAFLPLVAKAMLDASITPPKEAPLLRYTFVGGTEWNGYKIKTVEQRRVDHGGHITTDSAYLVYLGDTAVLAPNLDSLRDVLIRASSDQPTLATNPNFKRVVESARENGGETIYLSNLSQLFAGPADSEVSPGKAVVTESGSLRISNSTWENLFQLKFTRSDWLKPVIGFQPEQLESPKELLPRTTIAYYFMNFDAVAGWHDWSSQLLSAEQLKDVASIWGIDFEKEVLPELGPESGMAILGLPNILEKWEVPMVFFFRLKSDKLAKALQSGKLLNGSSAGSGPIHVKLKSSELFAVVKGNFLVLANSKEAIAALDSQEKLIMSRHFSRAAKEVPAGVMAFGGYNLEAAIAAIGDSGGDPVKSLKLSMVSALTNAFHSPNFYATATPEAVQGHFSLSMDREGRFSVSELASLSKDYRLSYAQIEPHGVPIQNQDRLSSLKLRVKATAAGEIDRIKEDVSSRHQFAEKTSEREIELKVLPRHFELKTRLELPIKAPEFAPYLQAGKEIRSDDATVIEKAREIAGTERDAWKVATKLADWTYKNIKWKQVDYATAQQTLATLEADCLEFSQLYVAMARSLGLPARIVSGVAYSGAAFGGHAWVEVYVGDWIEVDPTWGTDFVDATHIRDSGSGALLTYAALNLVEVEVLEAPRGIEDFQKDPRTLVQKLSQELPKGNRTTLSSVLDLALLTDENGGPGTWESLLEAEREAISSAYHRVLVEVLGGFRDESDSPTEMRLLKLKQDGEVAEAIVLEPSYDGLLLKFSLAHRGGAWFLTDILQVDTGLHIISETLRPTIKSILERRKNNTARSQSTSDFVRVLLVLNADPKAALTIADRVLKDDPKNQPLRYLKALALMKNERVDDGIQLLKELASEAKPFAPALLGLARHYDVSEDQPKQKLAIEFYLRYSEVEPEDPRPHVSLAELYDTSGDYVRAEAEHRLALKLDPANTDQFVDFAAFLAARKRFSDAALVIDEGDTKATAGDDLFGSLMTRLYFSDDKTAAEELARNQPQRMEKNAVANYYLGYARFEDGKTLQAITLFKKAAALKSDWAGPHIAMALSYRKLQSWRAALSSADTAIKVEADDSDAHYTRARVLARLGRIKEALESLAKAVELDPDLSEEIAEESDLKILASRPAFKKLLPVPEPKQ